MTDDPKKKEPRKAIERAIVKLERRAYLAGYNDGLNDGRTDAKKRVSRDRTITPKCRHCGCMIRPGITDHLDHKAEPIKRRLTR